MTEQIVRDITKDLRDSGITVPDSNTVFRVSKPLTATDELGNTSEVTTVVATTDSLGAVLYPADPVTGGINGSYALSRAPRSKMDADGVGTDLLLIAKATGPIQDTGAEPLPATAGTATVELPTELAETIRTWSTQREASMNADSPEYITDDQDREDEQDALTQQALSLLDEVAANL